MTLPPRICEYEPCGRTFTPTHPRQRFCCPTCRANQHYAEHPEKGRPLPAVALQCVAEHPLAEVRAEAEAKKEKARWTVIARTHLERTLVTTGYFSSEDFDDLGIPQEHVNVGNSQMGHYVKQGYMEAITWRYSSKPSRKGGKFWIYRITDLGREKLGSGVGGNNREGTTSAATDALDGPAVPMSAHGARSFITADPGVQQLAGVGIDVSGQSPNEAGQPPRIGANPGENPPAEATSIAACPTAEGTARLFDLPRKPLSAVSDPEAEWAA